MPFSKCFGLSQPSFTAYNRYLHLLHICSYHFTRMDGTHAVRFKDSAGWEKITVHCARHNLGVLMTCGNARLRSGMHFSVPNLLKTRKMLEFMFKLAHYLFVPLVLKICAWLNFSFTHCLKAGGLGLLFK